MPDERTVLWVIPVADLAGVARHVLDVARTGIPGWRLEVLVPPGPLADELERVGANVHCDRFGPEHGMRGSASSLRGAVALTRPQLVHSHLSYADIVAAVSAPRRCRLVSTEHGIALDDQLYHRSRFDAWLMTWAHRARIRRFGAVIAVSTATAEAIVAKWRPSKSRTPRVIHNGITAATAVRTDTSSLRVASISRLAPEKGIDSALDAFAAVHGVHPDPRFTIAGEGELLAHLQARAVEAGVGHAVDFVGHVDAADLLAQTDVLVQLSTWENCSYSLLDAASSGCGVVASNVGGNPEILPPRCLVEREATSTSITERIVEQAEDADARPSISAGWPDVAAMCDAIAVVYDEVMR